jgi:hypothetical protein
MRTNYSHKHYKVRMLTNEGRWHSHTGWIVKALPPQDVTGNELLERELHYAKQQLGEIVESSEFNGYELHITDIGG